MADFKDEIYEKLKQGSAKIPQPFKVHSVGSDPRCNKVVKFVESSYIQDSAKHINGAKYYAVMDSDGGAFYLRGDDITNHLNEHLTTPNSLSDGQQAGALASDGNVARDNNTKFLDYYEKDYEHNTDDVLNYIKQVQEENRKKEFERFKREKDYYNFYEMYHLGYYSDEKTTSTNNGFQFMPIHLSTTTWNEETYKQNGFADETKYDQNEKNAIGNGIFASLAGIKRFEFILPMSGDNDITDALSTNIGFDQTNILKGAWQVGRGAMEEFANKTGASSEAVSDMANGIETIFNGSGIQKTAALNTILRAQQMANGVGNIFDQSAINYDPTRLIRNLRFNFVLPITENLSDDIVNKEWFDGVKRGLGALMGQLYPTGVATIMPRMYRLTVGNLYRGFKGYISGVHITFSKEQITTKYGFTVPLCINGTLDFTSFGMYIWGNQECEGLSAIIVNDDYNLGHNPCKIFGTAESGNVTNADIVSSSEIKKQADERDKKFKEGQENLRKLEKDADKKAKEKLNDAGKKAEAKETKKAEDMKENNKPTDVDKNVGGSGYTRGEDEDKDITPSDAANANATTEGMNKVANTIASSVKKVTNFIPDTLKSFADSNPESIGSKFINSIIGKDGMFNLTNINNYVNLYNNIKNRNLSGVFYGLPDVLKSYSTDLSSAAKTLYDTYQTGTNVVNSLKNIKLNTNNIGSLFSNLNYVNTSLTNLQKQTESKVPQNTIKLAQANDTNTIGSNVIGSTYAPNIKDIAYTIWTRDGKLYTITNNQIKAYNEINGSSESYLFSHLATIGNTGTSTDMAELMNVLSGSKSNTIYRGPTSLDQIQINDYRETYKLYSSVGQSLASMGTIPQTTANMITKNCRAINYEIPWSKFITYYDYFVDNINKIEKGLSI